MRIDCSRVPSKKRNRGRNHFAGRIVARLPAPSSHGSSHVTPRGVESVEPIEIGQLNQLQIKPLLQLPWHALSQQKLLQTINSVTTFPNCSESLRQYMKRAIILTSIVLTACSATVPATMKIERNQILRGSASGKVGRDAVISVNNIEGLSCAGKMFVPVTETTTEGTIQCSDKRKGNFTANGKGDSWAGEGKLNDGSKFLILLGTKRTPLEY